jgi:hypothetical protein
LLTDVFFSEAGVSVGLPAVVVTTAVLAGTLELVAVCRTRTCAKPAGTSAADITPAPIQPKSFLLNM